MRILVVGAGATGGYFGARLALAGRDVTFLVRPRRARTLRERGLRVIDGGHDEVVTPTTVTADELTEPYDLILFSVKAGALDAAIKDVEPAVGPGTAIIPFLNGMAHLDALTARFGTAVLTGVVFIASTLDEHGDIVKLAPMARLGFGEQAGGTTRRLADIEATLSGAGFDVDVHADGLAEMWAKWVFIATVGGSTTLMRGSVGDIVAVPGGADLGPAFAEEGAAVAAAAGHPVSAERLAGIRDTVTRQGSPLTASMFRDVTAGLPTEVEHVFADLVARGRRLGVQTPLLALATLHLRVHNHRVSTP